MAGTQRLRRIRGHRYPRRVRVRFPRDHRQPWEIPP